MPWKKGKEDYVFTSSKMKSAASELLHWMSSESREFNDFVCRLVSALPGGDELEDAGYKPIAPLGWQEATMVAELLDAIETDKDVQEMAEAILGRPEEEEEEEEGEEPAEESRKLRRASENLRALTESLKRKAGK